MMPSRPIRVPSSWAMPFGDGPGGDAARLGVADHAGDAPSQLQADLGQLCGLARSGLAGDDDDLVVADGLGDLVAARADRQLLGVDQGGDRRARAAS